MKKITLLFAAIIAGFAVQAQEFAVESNITFDPNSGGNSLSVVWDQQSVGGNGIISDYSIPDDIAVYSADDFELTEATKLTTITVYGFQNLGNLVDIVNGFQLYIYENLEGSNIPNGNPTLAGTGVLELDEINTLQITGFPIVITEVGGYEFVIDITIANDDVDVVLPAGNYWLVAAPRMNISPVSDGDPRWNWFDAGVPTAGLNEAHLIDPADVFGAGATDWTSLTALGVSFASTAFMIEGDPALGTEDNISELASVYPNPANDILNVKIPSNVDVLSSSLYDILGKDTGVRLVNGTMNTSSLAKGVYILNVNTSVGTLTQKIVKQ